MRRKGSGDLSVPASSRLAFVKRVDTVDVIGAHLCGSSERKVGIVFGDDGRLAVSGEGVVAVMHDRVEVVGSSQVISLHLPEV